MIGFAHQFARPVMALLLAVALIGLGFGHRMVLQDPIDLSAYAMPDGTLPELCHDGSGAKHGGKNQPPCPLCRIVVGLDVPPIVGLPPRALVAAAVIWPDAALANAGLHHPRAPPARGPPARLI